MTLKNMVNIKGGFPREDITRGYMTELLHAVDYLHGPGIIHRDILVHKRKIFKQESLS